MEGSFPDHVAIPIHQVSLLQGASQVLLSQCPPEALGFQLLTWWFHQHPLKSKQEERLLSLPPQPEQFSSAQEFLEQGIPLPQDLVFFCLNFKALRCELNPLCSHDLVIVHLKLKQFF